MQKTIYHISATSRKTKLERSIFREASDLNDLLNQLIIDEDFDFPENGTLRDAEIELDSYAADDRHAISITS